MAPHQVYCPSFIKRDELLDSKRVVMVVKSMLMWLVSKVE